MVQGNSHIVATVIKNQVYFGAEAVLTCQYLDQIEASSGYGKNFNWTVLAKSSAMQKAEKLAATHIVWVRFDPTGGFNGGGCRPGLPL